VSVGLETLRLKDIAAKPEIDDDVLGSIQRFEPIRLELLELFKLISIHLDDARTRKIVHQFFNDLIPYLDHPEGASTWRTWDYDNFKYIANELFLTATAIYLKNECFDSVDYYCTNRYFDKKRLEEGQSALRSFQVFRGHLQSLDARNVRLKLNRLSLQADIIKERSRAEYADFDHLMQADLVLFLRDSVDALAGKGGQKWFPDTLVYSTHWPKPAELFVRCEEKEYFGRAVKALGIASKADMHNLIAKFADETLRLPTYQYDTINIRILTNADKLDTL